MVTRETIQRNLDNCLVDSSFLKLPNLKKGKVRDSFDLGDKLVMVTTDRQSAFDRLLANVPFKGQVLNQVSGFWFDKTKDIVGNHLLDLPDPNVMVVKKCTPIPIEFVVRGYLTGSTSTSSWTLYEKGGREMCGNRLPEGMKKNQKFPFNIITPTTKSDEHDEAISPDEIVKRGIMDRPTWDKLANIVLRLFARGQLIAGLHGLILVDTKYELGMDAEGSILLIDEVHTPDSSRFWIQKTYLQLLAEGKEPENIDKEFLRLWFKAHCDPYKDKELPKAPDDLVVQLSERYIQLYEMITGKEFVIDPAPIGLRMVSNLAPYAVKN